ncbi:MAG TPA: GreA/GreB family elongation factor [Stellaceae bacterium]|nr:GreA/GreB family elongation factor [Stellaceae bacterium]
MSRAFVKEQDGESGAGEIQDLPQSEHPNYVTPRGLAQLKERLAAAQEKKRELLEAPDSVARELPLAHAAREIRYLEARIERAILVDPAQQPQDEVAFGATVRVADRNGEEREFTIVGEDEADAEHGSVSWVSPLARALTGAAVGDVITWHRPAGDAELEIVAIRYQR